MIGTLDRLVLVGGGNTSCRPQDIRKFLGMDAVYWGDDFLGTVINKIETGNTTALWSVVETNLNTEIEVVAESPNGVVAIILDADDNAEVGALYFGDQRPFSIKQGLVFEARVTFHVLPTTGTEDVQAVIGLAADHNTDLDAITTNAWFKVESAAQTALLYESDDTTTDDDDNDAGVTLVADTYNVFKIDCTDISKVQFSVDGVIVGETDMSDLTDGEAMVQPYFNVSKAVSSNNTGTGTMYIDYVCLSQNRTQ